MKNREPNYQIMLKSAIMSLQQEFEDYKKAVVKNLQYTWFDDNGIFTTYEGVEKRNKDIEEKAKEVTRLMFKVAELKQEVESEDKE